MRINEIAVDTQVAKALSVDVRWLRREARSGRLPSVRAGKTFLFDPAVVERVLLQRARGTQTGPVNGCGSRELRAMVEFAAALLAELDRAAR